MQISWKPKVGRTSKWYQPLGFFKAVLLSTRTTRFGPWVPQMSFSTSDWPLRHRTPDPDPRPRTQTPDPFSTSHCPVADPRRSRPFSTSSAPLGGPYECPISRSDYQNSQLIDRVQNLGRVQYLGHVLLAMSHAVLECGLLSTNQSKRTHANMTDLEDHTLI